MKNMKKDALCTQVLSASIVMSVFCKKNTTFDNRQDLEYSESVANVSAFVLYHTLYINM